MEQEKQQKEEKKIETPKKRKIVNRENMKSIGSPDPNKKRALSRRRLKGADRRIARHEDRVDQFREIIRSRERVKIDSKKGVIIINLSEIDIEEYRRKKLLEETLLMQAKKDKAVFEQECSASLEQSNAELRKMLKNNRATEYARRMGQRTAENVYNAVKNHKKFPDVEATATKKRSEFRSVLWDLIVMVSPELKKELEGKQKLYTKVVDILQEKLTPIKKEGRK